MNFFNKLSKFTNTITEGITDLLSDANEKKGLNDLHKTIKETTIEATTKDKFSFSVPATEITSLNITTDVVNIHLMGYDGTNIICKLMGDISENKVDDYQLEHNVINDNLTINLKSPSKEISNNNIIIGNNNIVCNRNYNKSIGLLKLSLCVYLPSKLFNKAYFKSLCGDINISNVKIKKFNITANNGSIHIDNYSGNMNISSTNGDIEVENCSGVIYATNSNGDISLFNTNNEVTCRTTNGDINVDIGDTINNILLNTTNGDIIIKELTSLSNFKFKFETSNGDIRSKLKNATISIEKDNKICGTIGNPIYSVEVISTQGNIVIR